jgi:hypothetical protein
MNFNEFFKEYWYVGCLSESKQVEYYLICKYKDKVSQRLIKRQEELYEEGKKENQRILFECLSKPNPFLKMLPKTDGVFYPLPIISGIEDES